MTEYTNNDGLTRRYGVDEAQKMRVWEEPSLDRRVIEIKLDATSVAASHTDDPQGNGAGVYVIMFPKISGGFKIVGKELKVDVAWNDAGAPTLDVDLVPVDELDATSNAIALVEAAVKAELEAGDFYNTHASPIDGAALGSSVPAGAYVVRTTIGTAAWSTKGSAILRLVVDVPEKTTDTLGT
jgi:hypothetical protein